MAQAVFLLVVSISMFRAVRLVSVGKGRDALISGIAGMVYLFALFIPALLQAGGQVESKLYRAGFANPPSTAELSALCANWSIELLVIMAAEFVAINCLASRDARRTESMMGVSPRWVAGTLIFIGIAAYVAFPADVSERGQAGQGLEVLMRTFLLSGLAVTAYFGFFSSWVFRATSFVAVIVLIAGSVRSPLLFILIAFLVGKLAAGNKISKRFLIGAAASVVGLAILAAMMSNVRANTTRDLGMTTGAVVQHTLDEAWKAPFEAGLDTLDGYRFSKEVADYEPSRLAEPLTIVTTFIPTALWDDKPRSLSVELSAKYLGYKTSGQFLSPVGYATLVTGSYPLGLVLIALISFAFAVGTRRLLGTFWSAIMVTVWVRFMIGGSSFDFYYGLTLVIPVLAVIALFVLLRPKGARATRKLTRCDDQKLAGMPGNDSNERV